MRISGWCMLASDCLLIVSLTWLGIQFVTSLRRQTTGVAIATPKAR